MGFGNNKLSQGSKLFVLLLKAGIMGMIMLARATSGDVSDDLLCMSECASCSDICSSPPPPLLNSHPPPPAPSVHHSPPPPQPYHQSPPPTKSVSPPSPPPPPPPAAPSSNSSKGSPPPPFKYSCNAPPGQEPPIVVGSHEHPDPYHYFCASKASSLSFQASLISVLLLLLFNTVLFHC